MNTDDLDLLIDPDLDRRLRRTLHAVAETVTDEPSPVPARTARTDDRSRKRRRRVAALALAALPLVAFAYVLGPEYVDQIPPRDAFITGEAAGERYWVVPAFHADGCGETAPGVELVTESRNNVGQEWDTGGFAYGEWTPPPPGRDLRPSEERGQALESDEPACVDIDESAWLADPSRFAAMHGRLGADEAGPWITVLAVHPSVAEVRFSANGTTQTVSTTPEPSRPDGPRYAVFTVAGDEVLTQWALLTAEGAEVTRGSAALAARR